MPLSADERHRRYNEDPANRERRLTVDRASKRVRQAKRRAQALRGTMFEGVLTLEEMFVRRAAQDRREGK